MKICVLGTGIVGRTIAGKLSDLGHEVVIGTRDISTTLNPSSENENGRAFLEWQRNNPKVELATFFSAARESEILFNCISGASTLAALGLAGAQNLAGKILIDLSNPLDFSNGFPPTLSVCNDSSLAEQIQDAFPQTKVVKSLNTMTASLMVEPNLLKDDHNVFVCGNDQSAKASVGVILKEFGWKEINILDLGDITTSRGVEMYLPLWLRLWGSLQNGVINIKVVS
ncbi:MAG: NAD(P)-binding domain-containing protein [Actinobacteria bacterium]|nr:NAD(P)-binding domain-containing protein [Actinomycetota bacterium]